MDPVEELRCRKREIREQGEAARRALPDKDELSRVICQRFASLSAYAAAPTVMLYVHVRNEVRTQEFIATAMGQGKRVIVPYCVDNELELFHLEGMEELATARYGLLEPRVELRAMPGKRIEISHVDLVMVPGVAFDRHGDRIGHGKGYYDRLLRRARSDTRFIAVAFECQLFPKVPMGEFDVPMDKVATEKTIYSGRGRQ